MLKIFDAITEPTTSKERMMTSGSLGFSVQIGVSGTGPVSAKVFIEMCLNHYDDEPIWSPVATFNLSGVDKASDLQRIQAHDGRFRFSCAEISGTGAKVTAVLE